MRLLRFETLWPKPVVYALFKKGELLYIGQSVNLAGRLYAHSNKAVRVWWDEVWYQEVPKCRMNEIEAYLIKQCSPPFNIRGV
jgi:excinuclease UvrABC nuclease subunit